MVKSESSKRVKVSNGGIDRISNLPEDLISHILSFLPTKCAVSTSVLSTRWKLLWTSVTNIDLELDLAKFGIFLKREGKLKRNKFTQFVNRVVCLLNSPFIQKFHLSCICEQLNFDPYFSNSWISTAFGRTIKELDLNLRLRNPFELPLCYNYCNLTFLKLDGGKNLNMDFNIPATSSVCFPSLQTLSLHWLIFEIASDSSVSFPNLKNLRLEFVDYADEDFVHRLFSRCPVLEDLVIKKERWDNALYLIIHIPSLKSLTLHHEGEEYFSAHRLLIDTPALQYLDIYDALTHLAVENLNSLLKAKVTLKFVDEDNADVGTCVSFSNFIKSLSKVKFFQFQALRVAPVNISPGFHNLTRLEIDVYDCIDLSAVNIFLESMDNLEHLVMEGLYSSCLHQSWWTKPLSVPKCLLSRVTSIYFSSMDVGCCDQLELLRYFLKNAEVLQLMTISTRRISKDGQLEFVKKMSMVPRGSRACQVAFT